MQLELNRQQIEFILDELKDVREGNNYSQYAKTVAQQIYDKISNELFETDSNGELS